MCRNDAMNRFFAMVLGLLGGWQLVMAEEPVQALRGAHAHNDYQHERPLLDALAHGFQSVEADVFLVEGKLLVALNRNADERSEAKRF